MEMLQGIEKNTSNQTKKEAGFPQYSSQTSNVDMDGTIINDEKFTIKKFVRIGILFFSKKPHVLHVLQTLSLEREITTHQVCCQT